MIAPRDLSAEPAVAGVRPGAGQRVLGIDPGSVRVGVAISDPGRALATPLATVAGDADAAVVAARLADLAHDQDCGVVVVGLPVGLSGRDTESTRTARVLAAALEDRDLTVELWDERLTTVTADRLLAEGRDRRRRGGRPDARRRRDARDQAAATVLLQAWLDSHRARGDGDHDAGVGGEPHASRGASA